MTTAPTSPSPPAAVVPLGLAGYSLPLVTNVIATGLIITKLFTTHRGTLFRREREADARGTAHAARRTIAIIVESGLLYLAVQLAFVALFALV